MASEPTTEVPTALLREIRNILWKDRERLPAYRDLCNILAEPAMCKGCGRCPAPRHGACPLCGFKGDS